MGTILAVAPPMSWAKIERITLEFINHYAPQTLDAPQPFPIDTLVQFDLPSTVDTIFATSELLPSGYEGVTRYLPERDEIELVLSTKSFDGLLDGVGRDRMTAAHELGHAILHREQIIQAAGALPPRGLFRQSEKIEAYRNPERQAATFASRLLIPASTLDLAIKIHGPNIGLLAETFQVSYQAMKIRMGELGVSV